MATQKKTAQKASRPRAKRGAETAPPAEAPIFSMEGKKVGTIALPAGIFNAPWKSDLVHHVVTAMQANLRQNRAHTKNRAEVAGGGKKPWRQKGTGQARHGSTRSPLWRHGGVTFGPRTERDYSEKINRKMRRGALLSALSRKARDGELILVDELSFASPKTGAAKSALAKLARGAGAERLVSKKENAALVALAAHNPNAVKSFRNFGNLKTEEVRNLNPLDVLSYSYLIVENPASAFAQLAARVSK